MNITSWWDLCSAHKTNRVAHFAVCQTHAHFRHVGTHVAATFHRIPRQPAVQHPEQRRRTATAIPRTQNAVGFTTTTPPGNPSAAPRRLPSRLGAWSARMPRCPAAPQTASIRPWVGRPCAQGGHAAYVNQPRRLTMNRVHQIGRALGIDAPKRIAVVGVKRHQGGAMKDPRDPSTRLQRRLIGDVAFDPLKRDMLSVSAVRMAASTRARSDAGRWVRGQFGLGTTTSPPMASPRSPLLL